ncbi:hypothetical protein BU26DRAFT_30309 [Trematosphaeria pertusa]|uniref:Plasma membrane fusion protein PRM1 n=1 Tax=Trematosphaeria pertusa TaxID=390896 RepID=A0A6A6J1T5_9PLEO|nr:uncharacterized protein BU26DRAFT_30309 [Trematosphaeria pertusa]KAF2256835.1 hypothetical protein BU26DRAFT_30309 [Trematosphaeria pertusa]
MASTGNQQHTFPAVPPSLSAGDHEMRDYYAPQEAPRPTLNQTPYLKPYLGLRARLSQIWINRWTILLILVLVRLLFAIASTDSSLTSARREALSACTQVENIGSSMASMPHFMSKGINEMTATGVEKAVNGLMTMMDLSVTGVEEIVLFVIHMMTSTYLCLITLAVSGSLHAAVEIGNAIAKNLDETVDEVTNEMSGAVKSVTDGINSIIDKINFPFGPDFTKPEINLDDEINKLKALEVPPELQQGLQELNKSIPTFEDVQNFTDNIIRLPFEEVKKLIAGMDNFTFDRELLPVPQKEQLNFCSEGNSINNFFDDLIQMGYTARKIALGVLIALAIVVCVPMAYMEIRRYRRMEQRAALFGDGHEAMDVVYLASRPTSSGFGLWLGRRFGSARRQAIMRWAWAYATSVPMLFLISLGIAGLFSCFCQYLLLKGIEQKVPELTDQVADFAEKVVTSLNNASMSWSGGVNGAIDKLDGEINDEILGWVNTTTTAVNDTLNTFVDKMSTTLNDTFGGTVLYDPIKEVLNCLIGLKIASFQKGLTWVQDHAHVNFPGVKNDTFSLGALAQLSDSDSAAELLANPNGKAKDEVTEAIDHVIDKLISGIRTEALISTTLIVIWLLIALGGLIYACTHLARRDSATGTAYVIDPAIDNAPKTQEYPGDAAPPYEYPVNKAAPYTLQPRAFPTYGPSDSAAQSEKVGQVDAHAVTDSARPGHARVSSYGQLAEPSPLDEKQNPFADRPREKNPFAD